VWRRWCLQRRDTVVGDAIAAVLGPLAALGVVLGSVLMVIAMMVVWREEFVKPNVKIRPELEA